MFYNAYITSYSLKYKISRSSATFVASVFFAVLRHSCILMRNTTFSVRKNTPRSYPKEIRCSQTEK